MSQEAGAAQPEPLEHDDRVDTDSLTACPSFISTDWKRRPQVFHPILICVSGPQRGLRHKLTKASTIIGRSRSADFRLSDAGASREHMRISYENFGNNTELPLCFLEDLNSRNGTELNGKVVASRIRLAEHDRITVGNTVLGFFLRDEEELVHDESLYENATRDALTGLENRRQLAAFLRHYLAVALRRDTSLCLLLIDADKFKGINDTYGHLSGDEVLRHMAKTLVNGCRSSDLVARWGGEEIAIALPDTTIEQASQLAERLRATIEESTVDTGEFNIRYTVSIGGTVLNETDTMDTLFQRADQNLYRAKEAGRNRCVVG